MLVRLLLVPISIGLPLTFAIRVTGQTQVRHRSDRSESGRKQAEICAKHHSAYRWFQDLENANRYIAERENAPNGSKWDV